MTDIWETIHPYELLQPVPDKVYKLKPFHKPISKKEWVEGIDKKIRENKYHLPEDIIESARESVMELHKKYGMLD